MIGTAPPNTKARWYASCPADMDFPCGFQVNRFSGKRSRNLRVMGACSSNSASKDCASDITILLWPSNSLNSGFSSARCFCALADVFVNVGPALGHAGPVVILNQAKSGVPELDQRSAIF